MTKALRGAAALAALLAVSVAQAQEARFDWFDYRGSDPVSAGVTVGPDDYFNPVLSGFYPDPSITRAGDDYYLVNSTFAWFPGIPVFHSRDLVHWRQIGNAIDRPDQLDFKRLGLSRGVFAPAIEYHAGRFYILNTCVDCGGNFVMTATNPAGPWSDPVWLPDLAGAIDPSLFVDDDGSAWIVNNGPPPGAPEYEGHRAIWIQRFDLATMKTFGPRSVLVNGGVDFSKKPIWIEGPHILKKDGWYYLLCAEGGTAEGHSQVVLRSRRPDGPYVAGPNNPILTQRDLPRDRPHPITSAGHADLVRTQNGEWWATFLAVRPYRGDYYNSGRETFLLPVEWRDGWPVITRPGEAIAIVRRRPDLPRDAAPPTSGPFHAREEFDGPALPLNWMMLRNPRSRWYRFKDGALVLDARGEGLGDHANPSFLARRQQHQDATVETVVRFTPDSDGDRAGIVALQSDDYWAFLGIQRQGGRSYVALVRRAGPQEPATGVTVKRVRAAPGAPLYLRIEARGGEYRFSYALRPDGWHMLGTVDGTLFSTKRAGGFVGAVFGILAQDGGGR